MIGFCTSVSDDTSPHEGSNRRFGDFVERFEQEFLRVIQEKLNKKSLRSHAQENGLGTLLVGIFDPFTEISDLASRMRSTITDLMHSRPSVFDNVFLYEGIGTRTFNHIYSGH